MGLHKLDFFSIAPRNLIFQNTSNKTNLGGILTLLYIFVVVIISIFYLLDYIAKDDYLIEYTRYTHDSNSFYKMQNSNDTRYDPYLDFYFEIFGDNIGEPLSKDFKLLNNSDFYNDKISFIKRGKHLKRRISDIDFQILYKCQDENCTVPFEYISLYVVYRGFVIDHQNKTTPIYPYDNLFAGNFKYFVEYPKYSVLKWKVVKYKPDEGPFSFFNKLTEIDEEKRKKIAVVSDSRDSEPINYIYESGNSTIDYYGINYKIFGNLMFDIDILNFDEYKRTKKNIFDSISNICSLSLAIYNALSLFLTKFYSNSFDNYKIIEKILYNTKTTNYENIEKKDSIKINDLSDKNDSLLPYDNNLANINDNEDTEKIEEDINNKKLPKLRFYEYFFNNMYSNCCKIKNQQIISKCNEIISKYYSIEYILYNQIKLENLFKDYKWNDPTLNNYDNNKFIIDLKNLISPNEIIK